MKLEPITSLKRWEPVDAKIRSSKDNRRVSLYSDVIDQFNVEQNPRYLPTEVDTYCATFMRDVMLAMDAVVPWATLTDGTPVPVGTKDSEEMNANRLGRWFTMFGPAQAPWLNVGASAAQNLANEGRPTIAIWINPDGGHGHTTVVRPGDPHADGPWMTQAGRRNRQRCLARTAFPSIIPAYWSAP